LWNLIVQLNRVILLTNKYVIKKAFLIFLVGLSGIASSQPLWMINGKVYDKNNRGLPLPNVMIINKRTGHGEFADAEGKFTISALPTDSILFSTEGFHLKKIFLKDSLPQRQYNLEVPMQHLQYTLKEISVFATRNLSDIQKDIDKLGKKSTYSTTGANVLESPITALYERFSKYGIQKRKVEEWEDEEARRDVLKDLFRLYVKHDIIDLNDVEFDAFIKYLAFSDDFIKNASQFELVMAIKKKYETFKYRWK